jgi:hypothetical protein
MFDEALQWMPDQKTLLVKFVPAKMGPAVRALKRPAAKKARAARMKTGTRSRACSHIG